MGKYFPADRPYPSPIGNCNHPLDSRRYHRGFGLLRNVCFSWGKLAMVKDHQKMESRKYCRLGTRRVRTPANYVAENRRQGGK